MVNIRQHAACTSGPWGRVLCALASLGGVACGGSDGGAAGDATGSGVTTTDAGSTTSPAPGATSTSGAGGTMGGANTTGGLGSGVGAGGSGNLGTMGVATSAGGVATNGAGGASTTGGADGGSGGGGASSAGTDTVTRTQGTFTFRHFPVEVNEQHVWNGASSPGMEPVSTSFDTVVLENGYLRVTLLPAYGGRILSMLHKPTGRELLYQNPLGTPYLMYEGIFYYDYLVIMGGIFPSFPEPEHGKYWNQPYSFEVVNESSEAITVRMSRQDDLDLAEGVPEDYSVGRTDVLVELDVTLRAGSSSLDVDTKLTNTRQSSIPEFEYWTVTTLAPGSAPEQTAIGLNTRIIAAMDAVHLLESSWSWFGDAEERVADEVFRWNNLSYFENWVDQGTAFANPDYRANYSGLINYDNDTGILRVSDNVQTPGLKLWTFGRGSLDVDINDSAEWLRPTIEMWHGITPEFWDRATLSPNEVRQWSESYFPTLGLREVTAASEHGAVYLSGSGSGADTVLSAAATLTLPGQVIKAVLRLDGNVILEQDTVVAAADTTVVSATVASSEISPGAVFEAEFFQGDQSLLSGQIALQ